MNYALGKVIQPGGGASASALSGGRPAAGKTGTSNDNSNAWFIGYTPQLSTAVWMGHPDNQTIRMIGVNIAGRNYPRVYGSTIPAPIWKTYMDQALAKESKEGFDPIPASLLGSYPKPTPPPSTGNSGSSNKPDSGSSGGNTRNGGSNNGGGNNGGSSNNGGDRGNSGGDD